MTIQYKLTEQAKKLKLEQDIDITPRRISKGDAGWDLSACINKPIKIYPEEVIKIPTGVCIFLGTSVMDWSKGEVTLAGLYLPRSSFKGLVLENTVGLLDSEYQEESFCKWRNRSDNIVTINPGDRMAQLVIFGANIIPWLKVEEFKELTERGKGDGSSGK